MCSTDKTLKEKVHFSKTTIIHPSTVPISNVKLKRVRKVYHVLYNDSGTHPLGMLPMAGRIQITSHMYPPPLFRSPPHGYVSRYSYELSLFGAGLMMISSSLHKLCNLLLTYSSPWTWIPLLSPVVCMPPHLAVFRSIRGCIPLTSYFPGSSSGRPSQTYVLVLPVFFSHIWAFYPWCVCSLCRKQYCVSQSPTLSRTMTPVGRIPLESLPLPLHQSLC